MAAFKTILSKSAEKELEAFNPQTRLQILQDIKSLETSPFPRGTTIKRLHGFKEPLYRLRSGDYRVVYSIEGTVIVILLVVDRKNFERALRSL